MMTQDKVPVLLIIFNRPDTTLQVFNAIKKYKPKEFFIASDGPRESKEGEKSIVAQTRNLVLDGIDWDCEVKTYFREKNVGCGLGVSGAISWFFENVKMGVILEDDCLPHQDFFPFCAEMLNKFKNDESIMHINGYNPYGEERSNLYFKTIRAREWGWATWANRWEKFNFDMDDWPQYINNKKKILSRYYWLQGKIYDTYWKMMKKDLDRQSDNTIWDTQWNFTIVMNKGYSLQPNVNLIQNIGLDSGTHFSGPTNSSFETTAFGSLIFPIEFSEKASIKHDRKEGITFMRKKTFAFFKKFTRKLFSNN